MEKFSARCSWLAANEGLSEWDELNARTHTSGVRAGERRDELIKWSGADPGEFVDLLGEVLAARTGLDVLFLLSRQEAAGTGEETTTP